jgi:hypothetical protein
MSRMLSMSPSVSAPAPISVDWPRTIVGLAVGTRTQVSLSTAYPTDLSERATSAKP